MGILKQINSIDVIYIDEILLSRFRYSPRNDAFLRMRKYIFIFLSIIIDLLSLKEGVEFKMKKVIAGHINEKLCEKGWSVHKLAKESGLSVSTIYNISKGNTMPKTRSLMAIANALDTSMGYLVGEERRHRRYIIYLQKNFLPICRKFDGE